MNNNLPLVSIIIPCRNEEKYIGKLLDSIILNDYSKDKMEVLVVDGKSEDKTREIVKDYVERYSFIKLVDNPKKFTNFALNTGIKEAKGEVIMLIGAHAFYEKNYISKCIQYLKNYGADNVGGVIKTLPSKNTAIAKAISICLSHRFGAGSSYFRTSSKITRWVDTVFGGCYKREVFKKIGLFNENLKRNQDMEFNLRFKKAGGKILLTPDIINYYYSISNLKDFFTHNFNDGFWITYPLKFIKTPFKLRHYIPLIFVSSLIGTGLLGIFFRIFSYIFLFIVELYFLANVFFSAKITLRKRDLRYLFVMPIVFANRHFAYGLGSLWGLLLV